MKAAAILFLLSGYAVFASAFSDPADEPSILSKVEPNWGNLTDHYLLENVDVEVTLKPTGELDSLRALVSSLPDPVVQALAQWRFTAFRKSALEPNKKVFLRVPVRRKIDADLERAQRPRWFPSEPYQQAMSRANSLDDDKAAELAASLPRGEEPDHYRTTLLVYYARKGAVNVSQARKVRRELLLWLIQTFPQDEILSSAYAVMNANGEPLADAEGVELLKAAWLTALKEYPKDLLVAESAAHFLLTIDPAAALRIIAEKNGWDMQSNVLGDLYARAGLGIAVTKPGSGAALATEAATLSDKGLAYAFRKALLESQDLKLVLSGVDSTTLVAHQLETIHALPAGYVDYCRELMSHLRVLNPETTLNCALGAHPDVPLTHAIARETSDKDLTKSVQPSYPRSAKKNHVFGRVRLLAVIDKDGHVQRLELLSAPAPLYQPTRDAVLQWEFKPTLVNAKPVAVSRVVVVDFVQE